MFWQILFWVLLVPTLIVLGIIYGTSKRLYKLFYILATFTYVITIAYVIDVFDLGRNWILGLLTFSAILMILLGYRLTRKGEEPKRRPQPTRRNLALLFVILAAMLLLIVVAALNLGATRDVTIAKSVSREAIVVGDGKGYQPLLLTIANFTYANSFIVPYVVPDHYFAACWYDSAKQEFSSEELQVQVNGQYAPGMTIDPFDEVMVGTTVKRRIDAGQSFYPVPVDAKGVVNETARREALSRYLQYDAIVLAASSDPFNGCANIAQQRQKGRLTLYKEIPLTE